MEDGEWWPVGGSLKYNTVLQLDQFCKEQGKWVEVAYVLPFLSLQNMPDLCPKGIDLGMKPSAPPYLGLQTGIQTAHMEVQTTPVSVRLQTTLVSVETQTIKVSNEIQTAHMEVQTTPVSV